MLPVTLTMLPDLRLVDPREYCAELKKIVNAYATIMARRAWKRIQRSEIFFHLHDEQKNFKGFCNREAPDYVYFDETIKMRIRVYQLIQNFWYTGSGVYQKIPEYQNTYIIHIDYRDIFDYYEWKGIRVGPDRNPNRVWFHDSYMVAALAHAENLLGDFYTDVVVKAYLAEEPTHKNPQTGITYKRKMIITRAEVGTDIVLSQMDIGDACTEIAMEFKELERARTSGKYGVQLLQSIISKRNTKDKESEDNARKLTYAVVFVTK